MTLLDFFTARSQGRLKGKDCASDLAMSALGLDRMQWHRRKDKPIRELGVMYGLALSALLNEKAPFTRYGGANIEQLAFAAIAAGLPPYWGDGK